MPGATSTNDALPVPPLVVTDCEPNVGSVMVNVASPPTAVLAIVIVASFVSVNTQLTVAPGAGVIVTPFVVATHPVPLVTNDQPDGTDSVTVYACPGVTSVNCCGADASVRENDPGVNPPVAENENDVGSPAGSVTLSTEIVANFVFVIVHVTLAPAPTTTVPDEVHAPPNGPADQPASGVSPNA